MSELNLENSKREKQELPALKGGIKKRCLVETYVQYKDWYYKKKFKMRMSVS